MKNPIRYIKNAIRVLKLKIRFGNKVQIGWIQSFEKIRIEKDRDSSLLIGNYNQNREKMYLGLVGKGKLTIGNHCFFNINASITCVEQITIGDYCKFGNNLVIVDHDNNYKDCGIKKKDSQEFLTAPIKIGNNVWVGANVVILRGTDIGDNCVIAAGSVVKGTVLPNTLFVKGERRSY